MLSSIFFLQARNISHFFHASAAELAGIAVCHGQLHTYISNKLKSWALVEKEGSQSNLTSSRQPGLTKSIIGLGRLPTSENEQCDQKNDASESPIQAGVDVYTVQKLGRWKTISMV